jgi:hypothetical protein
VNDLALVGQSGISAGGNWNLNDLHSLFLGTNNGTISLNNTLNLGATAGSGFKFLEVYARGGNATVGATINNPAANLHVASSNNVILDATSAITVKAATIHGDNSVNILGSLTAENVVAKAVSAVSLNGIVNANSVDLNAPDVSLGGRITATNLAANGSNSISLVRTGTVIRASNIDLTSGGTVTLPVYDLKTAPFTSGIDFSTVSKFNVTADSLVLTGSIKLPYTMDATLSIGAGGINAPTFSLGGFRDITVAGGNLAIDDLHSNGTLTVSGNVTGREIGARNTIVGGTISLTGKLETFKEDDSNALHTYTASSISAKGVNQKGPQLGIVYDGAAGTATTAPGKGTPVELHADFITFDSVGFAINGATLSGGSASASNGFEGGNAGSLSVGSSVNPIPGQINVNAPITATSGANGKLVATGGSGGTVKLISADTIKVNAAIKVSDSVAGKASKSGGNILLESRKTSGNAIEIGSSAQLNSLLATAAPGAGGKIEFKSSGGQILANGGIIRADRGTVDIQNTGAGGAIALNNVQIAGNVVKVGALGNDGSLTIGGGSLKADTLLHLYAAGANGSILFNNNTTLDGAGAKIIAANSVTIANGKAVTVGGIAPAGVFANQANFTGSGGNGSTTGRFTGAGAIRLPIGNAPSY